MHRLLNGQGLEIGQGLLAQAAVAGTGLHHHCRPELVWFRRLVILGWVQKAPQLLDVVHSLVEERAGPRFVLTGSSARKLRHGAANLLGGPTSAGALPTAR
ncbi:MAG: hypothetical protein RLZZ216_726 [Cyanobacteriota bacterium]|jgi:hypothetical protein